MGAEVTPVSLAKGEPYEIVSIRRADAPAGTDGSDWYRYKIIQGHNAIEGHRRGSLTAVTSAVEIVVAQLNERRLGKRGRVNLVPTPKRKKA